jgi:cytochrome b
MRGFIGPENAHFRSFFPTQKRVLNNLKNFKTEQLSHQAHSHHSALGAPDGDVSFNCRGISR